MESEMIDFQMASPYEAEVRKLKRRQKMAELLQAQAFQPEERFSYKGIEAPISPWSGLAKLLQSYMSGREMGRIGEAEDDLFQRRRTDQEADVELMTKIAAGQEGTPGTPGSTASYSPVPNPNLSANDLLSGNQPPNANFSPVPVDSFDPLTGLAGMERITPAVPAVAARRPGQIDPAMIAQFKTPEMQRMALALLLKQGELPAAFNLGAGETRFQPPVGEGAPVPVATGASKKPPTTNLNRLLRERAALPPGDPKIEVYNEAIKKESETAPTFDQENTLRNEFTKGAGEFVKVRDAYNRIVASVKDPSAAGDLSLIFNYMKVLDPGSTVREGEFATAQNSAGVPDIVRAKANSLRSGERLSDVQRNDFANRAKMLYTAGETQYEAHEARYRGLAEMYNLDPDKVVYGMGAFVPDTSEELTGGDLPPIEALEEGVNTAFDNDQVWTLVNGVAKRVR